MFLLSCFILLMLFNSGVQSLTYVGGVLLSNTIWTSDENANPYYLVGDVEIPSNITLTIQAGVEVRFDRGDFEILVKGSLQVRGTLNRSVLFYNGSAYHTKWMINFHSTQLDQSSISGAIFKGPKRGLQTTSAVSGFLQNRGVLVLQSVAFLNNATLATNGMPSDYYTFPDSRSAIELHLSSINNSMVLNGNSYSESIRLVNSQVINSQIQPKYSQEGMQFINCMLDYVTFRYIRGNTNSLVTIAGSVMTNSVAMFGEPDYSSSGSNNIKIQRSVIHNASFLFVASNPSHLWNSLAFENSILSNVLLNGTTLSSPSYSNILYQYQIAILINKCIFNQGYIFFGVRENSLDIRNSTLIGVNLIGSSNAFFWYGIGASSSMTMLNTNFQHGSIKMSPADVQIRNSNISLLNPPLDTGPRTLISCSSIVRSSRIRQENTTGVNATDLQMIKSSISDFQTGLRLNATSRSTVIISDSNFESNTLYNIDNLGPYTATATGNWWGTDSLPMIRTKINDYWDDKRLGEVTFLNFSSTKLLAERSCSL